MPARQEGRDVVRARVPRRGRGRHSVLGRGSVEVREWSVRERRRLGQDGAGFGSAMEAVARLGPSAGAVGNGGRRRNRLGDAETEEEAEARAGHGVMMADHMGHGVERPDRVGRLHRSTAIQRMQCERVI